MKEGSDIKIERKKTTDLVIHSPVMYPLDHNTSIFSYILLTNLIQNLHIQNLVLNVEIQYLL